MIATLEEYRRAKAHVDGVREELSAEGVEVPDVPVGIMVEVPAAVVMAARWHARWRSSPSAPTTSSSIPGHRPHQRTRGEAV